MLLVTLADPLDATPPLLFDLVQALVFLVFWASPVFLLLLWTNFLLREAFLLSFLLLVMFDRLVGVAPGDFIFLFVVRETIGTLALIYPTS